MIKTTRPGGSATVPGTNTLSNHCGKRVPSIQAFDWSKYGTGGVRPAPQKHSGALEFPVMAIGSFSVPAALVQKTSVTRSSDFMDRNPRASRRAPDDAYDCEGKQ